MLINPYLYTEKENSIKDSRVYFKEAEILTAKRVFYLIESDYQTDKNYKNFDVIQINTSRSKGSPETVPVLFDESLIKSVYTYQALLPLIDGKIMLENSRFSLKNVVISGVGLSNGITSVCDYCDYGFTIGSFSVPVASINFNYFSEYEDYGISDRDSLLVYDPRFYNEKHYEIVTKEPFSSLLGTGKISNDLDLLKEKSMIFSYDWWDLYDSLTEVYIVNKDKNFKFNVNNDTKALVLSNEPNDICRYVEECTYTGDISDVLFKINSTSLIKSYNCVYESGVGFNIFDTIYYKDYYVESKSIEFFKDLKSEFVDKIGKKMEEKFGRLRISYHHDNVNDIVRISFEENELKELVLNLSQNEIIDRASTNLYEEYYNDVMQSVIYYQQGKSKVPMYVE